MNVVKTVWGTLYFEQNLIRKKSFVYNFHSTLDIVFGHQPFISRIAYLN